MDSGVKLHGFKVNTTVSWLCGLWLVTEPSELLGTISKMEITSEPLSYGYDKNKWDNVCHQLSSVCYRVRAQRMVAAVYMWVTLLRNLLILQILVGLSSYSAHYNHNWVILSYLCPRGASGLTYWTLILIHFFLIYQGLPSATNLAEPSVSLCVLGCVCRRSST